MRPSKLESLTNLTADEKRDFYDQMFERVFQFLDKEGIKAKSVDEYLFE